MDELPLKETGPSCIPSQSIILSGRKPFRRDPIRAIERRARSGGAGGVLILPHDPFAGGDLDHVTTLSDRDQRVPVRKPLRAADELAVEVLLAGPVPILPDYVEGDGVELEYARVRA